MEDFKQWKNGDDEDVNRMLKNLNWMRSSSSVNDLAVAPNCLPAADGV